MGRLFGTDGVRGLANDDLTANWRWRRRGGGRRLGTAQNARRVAVVGRDPRASGEMLEAAVIAGLTIAGMDVLRVGVLPTPAVAYLTGCYGAGLGVMISASHNPMPDNGIKIFAAGGHKLDDAIEDRIEAMLGLARSARPTGAGVGRVATADDPTSATCDAPGLGRRRRRLDGLTVVVDCANGAASTSARRPTGPRART